MQVQQADLNIASVISGTLVTSGTNIASTKPPPVPEPATEPPSPERMREVTKHINQTIRELARNIEFSVDEASGATIVRVIDQDTHEVIRQMPSEEALAISKNLDRMMGLLIRDKA